MKSNHILKKKKKIVLQMARLKIHHILHRSATEARKLIRMDRASMFCRLQTSSSQMFSPGPGRPGSATAGGNHFRGARASMVPVTVRVTGKTVTHDSKILY